MCFIDMYHFRYTPNTSHRHILKFKVAVAEVPWGSIFKMWLWLRFWGSRNQKKRFELTIVMRNVLHNLYKSRSPGEVRRGIVCLVYSIQLSVDRLTGGDR